MSSGHIHLSKHQVRQLLAEGCCEWRRDCRTGAPRLLAFGAELAVRESVAKPKKGETAYRYEADGREPGYFYLPNYQMPAAATRLRVGVLTSWLDYRRLDESDEEQEMQCYTLKRLSDVVPA